MIRPSNKTFAAAAAVGTMLLTACNDSSTSPNNISLASAFSSAPTGFSSLTSSFATDGTEGPFRPDRGGPGGPGFGGGPGGGPGFGGGPGGGFMGGGLDGGFIGAIDAGRGFGHGPFGGGELEDNCAFAAATGAVTCGPNSRDGLTITRIYNFLTAANVAQARPDSTTNSIRTRVTVAGSTALRDSASSVIDNASDRTVTGIAPNSTQRTVNGTLRGSETTTSIGGRRGAFTAVRTAGDTVVGVIVPVTDGRPTYPTAGTITRSMKAVVTMSGEAAKTTQRREVLTYDGTATAHLVITQDGVTKTCTVPLPRG